MILKRVGSHVDGVALVESMRGAQRSPVEFAPVLGAGIFHPVEAVLVIENGVTPGNGASLQNHIGLTTAAADDFLSRRDRDHLLNAVVISDEQPTHGLLPAWGHEPS